MRTVTARLDMVTYHHLEAAITEGEFFRANGKKCLWANYKIQLFRVIFTNKPLGRKVPALSSLRSPGLVLKLV